MYLESYSVSEAVGDVGVVEVGDIVAGGFVDVGGVYWEVLAEVGGEKFYGFLLGVEDCLVGFLLGRVGFSEEDGSGHVGAVVVEFDPEVDEYGFVFVEGAMACVVVGDGGVFSEGDDGGEGDV